MTKPKKFDQKLKPGYFQTGTSLKENLVLMQLPNGQVHSMSAQDALALIGGLIIAVDALKTRKKEGW